MQFFDIFHILILPELFLFTFVCLLKNITNDGEVVLICMKGLFQSLHFFKEVKQEPLYCPSVIIQSACVFCCAALL